MIRSIRFLAQATAELAEAAEWYEARRAGLGIDFVAEVDTALAGISEHPEASPRWRADRPYRRHVLQRFPYVVFFRLLGDNSIEVTAVAHARRRPGYWL